jgi:hypothetical protein
VRRLGSPRLALHTQLTYAYDLGDGLADDPRLWLSSAYVDRRLPLGFLCAGRQYVWGGVASGRLDGLRLRVTRRGWSVFDLFAGVRSGLDVRGGLDGWSDSHMFGGRWQWTRWRRTELALSFVEMSRARRPYRSAGLYSEDDYWLRHEVSALRQRLVGLEASREIAPRVGLQGRADFDLQRQRVRLGEIMGRRGGTSRCSIRPQVPRPPQASSTAPPHADSAPVGGISLLHSPMRRSPSPGVWGHGPPGYREPSGVRRWGRPGSRRRSSFALWCDL